jgi:GTPase SAR1 family protein
MSKSQHTYDAIRRPHSSQTRSSTRSRLRTYTNPLPEVHPQAELSHKILVVGGAKVGKSSITRYYAEHVLTETYSQTIGSDLYVVPYGVLCGRQVYLKILDVGHAEVNGSPSFLSLTTSGTSGVLLVFDVTNPQSLASLDQWVATLRSYIPSLGTRVPVMVLANKADRLHNSTTVQHIKSIDLDNYVKSNNFTGWKWSTTRAINNRDSRSRLDRCISDAVHTLVEAILVSASEYYSKRKSISTSNRSGGNNRQGSNTTTINDEDKYGVNEMENLGALEQLLRTHRSATYVQIPQTARPGDSKLEAGAALCLPSTKEDVDILSRVVLDLKSGGGGGGGGGGGQKNMTREETNDGKRYHMFYKSIESELIRMMKRLNVNSKGGVKLKRQLKKILTQCKEEAALITAVVSGEKGDRSDTDNTFSENIRRWRIVLREIETMMI